MDTLLCQISTNQDLQIKSHILTLKFYELVDDQIEWTASRVRLLSEEIVMKFVFLNVVEFDRW